MPVEMAIWRVDGGKPVPVAPTQLDLEQRLEDMLVADPTMVGLDLLVLGRQVRTSFGGYIDVLGLDADGRIHVLELKRDKTSRDVVAQTLDYGAWTRTLALADLEDIFERHQGNDPTLIGAFAARFGTELPDVINAEQRYTIVASELDPASDRIVQFLAENFGVPVNAVFFRHFTDDNRDYLARTWLIDPQEAEAQAAKGPKAKTLPWNGRDFYAVLGRIDGGTERWDIARKYGFLSAGGGSWYWKPLQNLAPGKRVFAYVGGAGYVGVGTVTGEMIPARLAQVDVDGSRQLLIEQPNIDEGFIHRSSSEDPEVTEMVVAIDWITTRDLADAVKQRGLFASQVTVCKLKDTNTISVLEEAFGAQSDL